MFSLFDCWFYLVCQQMYFLKTQLESAQHTRSLFLHLAVLLAMLIKDPTRIHKLRIQRALKPFFLHDTFTRIKTLLSSRRGITYANTFLTMVSEN